MLVDTGASVTILKKDFFEKLMPSSRDSLKSVNLNLVTATGEISSFMGKLNVDVSLGNYLFNHDILVADIQNDGILGVDFLSSNKIDVLLSNSCLSIRKNKIPCFHFNKTLKPTICRIAVAEDIVIPPDTEIIVPGKLVDPVVNMDTALVSAVSSFVNKTGLLMANAIVKPENRVIPLRLMNSNNKVCKVLKDTVAANIENVKSVETQINKDPESVVINNITASDADELPPHLSDLYENSCKGLNEVEKVQFRALLINYQDAFSKDPKDIGSTALIEHTIDTGDVKPIKIPPRRIPISKLKQAEQEMADRDIIEPSDSPWCSPVVLITKHDGSLRFCIDYRQVNAKTIKSGQPLNRIDDSLDALAGAKLFSVLDLRSGYWNVKIAEQDRKKTAFAIPGSGLWQFKKMPFGLCNAPATFVRLMEKVLRGLSWKICLVYLDDIIVMSRTFDEHIENLAKVISCLKQADLKLHPKKCDFLKKMCLFWDM